MREKAMEQLICGGFDDLFDRDKSGDVSTNSIAAGGDKKGAMIRTA